MLSVIYVYPGQLAYGLAVYVGPRSTTDSTGAGRRVRPRIESVWFELYGRPACAAAGFDGDHFDPLKMAHCIAFGCNHTIYCLSHGIPEGLHRIFIFRGSKLASVHVVLQLASTLTSVNVMATWSTP